MKTIAVLTTVLVMAASANAAITASYGWEDGGTILGSYGNLVNPINQGVIVNSGLAALQVTESPHDGTPQAYVAYIEGLTDGDVITASFYGYDDTEGASPSLRIWAHYAVSGDIDSYAGSITNTGTYTSGIGWEQVSDSWTFDSDSGTRDALVIEVRLYSTPTTGDYSTDYWIDDLTVTSSNDASTITTPVPEPATMVLLGLGGLLLRRKK